MKSLVDLSDKRILVVGASSGIGRQTAISLSQVGAKLSLVARNEERLQSTIEALEGGDHDYFTADVSELNGIEGLIKRIVAKNGRLDGLVFSVGIGMSMPLSMFKPEKLQSLFTVNFFSFIEMVRQVTKRTMYNEGMRIVGVSSIASLKGDKTHLGYSATKAAMDAAVRCIAKEVADKGICINTVAPGMTATEMYEKYSDRVGSDSDSFKELMSRQYLGVGQPTDIANAIVFLMSPAARFITGITMPVDGGLTTC